MAEARTRDMGVGMTVYVASQCGKCSSGQNLCHETCS